MKKILGLDLGTTSVGWALVNEAEHDNEESSIIRLGVRVVPLTTDEESNFEKGKSITTNAERQLKRSMRRNTHRFKLRRRNLKNLMIKLGWISKDTILSEEGEDTTHSTLMWRARAAEEKISLEEFAKVLLMINKKRGYKSSRKTNDTEEGAAVDAIDIAIELSKRKITPGIYCFELAERNEKLRKKDLPQFYKSDLLKEREIIWKKQSEFYPELLTEETYRRISLKNKKDTTAYFYAAHDIKEEVLIKKEELKQVFGLRKEAVNNRITLSQLVTVLADINGELSGSSNYLAEISDRSKEIYFKNKTIGQYLYEIIKENPHHSIKNMVFYRQDYEKEFETIWNKQAEYHNELTQEAKDKIKNRIIFYQRPLKSKKGLIDHCEFESREVHITIDGKEKVKVNGLRVAPKSSPIFQEFKIWQKINDVKEKDRKNRKEMLKNSEVFQLDAEQKQRLAIHLTYSEKLSDKDIAKIVWGKNKEQFQINFDEIQGNSTLSAFYNAAKEIVANWPNWERKFSKNYDSDDMAYIEKAFKNVGADPSFLSFDSSKEPNSQLSFRLWHLLYSYEGDNSRSGIDSLIKKIMQLLGLKNEDDAKIISNIKMPEEYGNLSSKAMRKIMPFLKQGYMYSEACEKAGYRHSKRSLSSDEIKNKEYLDKLEILEKDSLRNPVVEKILNQMIHVINQVSETYGKPDEIRVEMARSLKSNAKVRAETTKRINASKKLNEDIKEILRKPPFSISHPSRNDVTRYKLYEELKNNGYKCLYCNEYIPREELFSKKFDIEHIIPQSRLFNDSFANKTIAHRDCNLKKSNRTGIDFVEQEFGKEALEQYQARIARLKENGEISETKATNLLTKGEDIPDGFIDRDLRNTQYISKKAVEILENFVPRVTSTTGSITAMLRQDWQLVNVMQELNWDKYDKLGLTTTLVDRDGREFGRIEDWSKRNDHRHHAVDALTVAFTKPIIIQCLNTLNGREDVNSMAYKLFNLVTIADSRGRRSIAPPFEIKKLRRDTKEELNNILVSIKSKTKVTTPNINKIKVKDGKHLQVSQLTPRGQLHKETVYGKNTLYETEYKKVGGTFDSKTIEQVANKAQREALKQRLEEFGMNPKKAFTGKNSPSKNPIYLNQEKTVELPEKVKLVRLTELYTCRKPIGPDLKLEQVINPYVREALQRRLDEYEGDKQKAFSNLDEHPIYLHKDKKGGITIKRVTIKGPNKVYPIHTKKDLNGEEIRIDDSPISTDYVALGNNHHISFFEDENGQAQEVLVSFYEATQLAIQGLPIFNEHINEDLGWKHLMTLKQNEYVIMPDQENEFDPRDYDLKDRNNYRLISRYLFRVQKISNSYYTFRHHLETNVEEKNELQNIAWIRISSVNKIKELIDQGMTKVRVNHIGEIVEIY